jgi:hypothetical protein
MSSNIQKLCLALLLCFAVPGAALFGQNAPFSIEDLTQHLSRTEKNTLLGTGKVIFFQKDQSDIQYFPLAQENQELIRNLENKNPNALIEALYLIPEPLPPTKRTALFNEFLKVSELDTIRYYNPEHEQRHKLFGFSYRIEEKNKPERIASDLELANMPRQLKVYVHQELLPVGPMTSEFSLRNHGERMDLSIVNVTNLNYGMFPVIGEGAFFSEIRVYFGRDFTLFYAVGGINFFNPFNIFGDRINPFFYRFEGIFDYYKANAFASILE